MKRRSFTLLEVLLAMALIVIAGSVLAFFSAKAVRYYQTESKVKEFFLYLEELQSLALSYRNTFSATLYTDPKGILRYSLNSDELVPAIKNKKEKKLPGIESIEFNPIEGNRQRGNFVINFFPSGNFSVHRLMSGEVEGEGKLGTLSLHTSKETFSVDLRKPILLQFQDELHNRSSFR